MDAFQKIRYRRPEHRDLAVRLRPVFRDFHLMKVQRDVEYPAHVHAAYELILVQRGPYLCRLNEQELQLGNGDVLVIQPGDTHQDHLRRGQRHYVLHFEFEAGAGGAPPLFTPGVRAEEQVSRAAHQRDVNLVKEIGQESGSAASHASAIQDSLLQVLFWRTLRNLPPAGLSTRVRRLPKEEQRRTQILAVLQSHLEDRVSTEQLARELRLSPRHLTNHCRALFGQPPARLLLSLKIDRADELLRDHRLRVKEVSDRLGFVNPYHFSRAFKRVRGVPPSALA